MGRDGYVHWDGAWYGVAWSWAGRTVQVGLGSGTVEIWLDSDRLAVHPRAHRRGQRLTLPGQWYRIKARNAHGLSERSEWFDANTPAAPSAANNPATGAPVITGTPQVGEPLTADTSGIADADGLTGVSYATGVSSYTGEEYKIPAAEGVWVIEASHDERFPATAHISTRGDVSAIPNTLTWPPAMAEAEDVVLPPDVGVGLIACAEADDVLVMLHDDQGVELQRYMVDIDPDAVVATPVPQEQPTGVDTQGVYVCVDSADHRANFLDGWEYAGAAFDWDALATPQG